MKEHAEREAFFYVAFVAITFFFPRLLRVDASAMMKVYKKVLIPEKKKIKILPPPWVFPLVWLTLYVLIGVSMALIALEESIEDQPAIFILFIVNMILNSIWQPLFVWGQWFSIALLDIVALLGTSIAILVLSFDVSKLAFALYFPYVIWLFFAFFINLQICRFCRPQKKTYKKKRDEKENLQKDEKSSTNIPFTSKNIFDESQE